MTSRRPLDKELVARRLVRTLEEARRVIAERRVLVDGAPAMKAGTMVAPNAEVGFLDRKRFVSRGGFKLEAALERFGIEVQRARCLDAGASTGGFTDCLLQRGAAEVVAVDVAYGQIASSLREDDRVRVVERTNIRTADLQELGPPFDVVVADLSFISLRAVLNKLISVCSGHLVVLVKPQFEATREKVGKGGVVADPEVWRETLTSVCDAVMEEGWGVAGVAPAVIKGAEGNQEFFVWATKGGTRHHAEMIESAVRGAS